MGFGIGQGSWQATLTTVNDITVSAESAAVILNRKIHISSLFYTIGPVLNPVSTVFIGIVNYRKTLDRSQAPNRRQAPHTGWGSDSLVPIDAGPRLQAGSHIQARGWGLVKYGC